MKPDYKNWMPKGMVCGTLAGTLVCLVLFIIFGCTGLVSGTAKTVLFVVFLVATVVCACVTLWMALMYCAFDYNADANAVIGKVQSKTATIIIAQ